MKSQPHQCIWHFILNLARKQKPGTMVDQRNLPSCLWWSAQPCHVGRPGASVPCRGSVAVSHCKTLNTWVFFKIPYLGLFFSQKWKEKHLCIHLSVCHLSINLPHVQRVNLNLDLHTWKAKEVRKQGIGLIAPQVVEISPLNTFNTLWMILAPPTPTSIVSAIYSKYILALRTNTRLADWSYQNSMKKAEQIMHLNAVEPAHPKVLHPRLNLKVLVTWKYFLWGCCWCLGGQRRIVWRVGTPKKCMEWSRRSSRVQWQIWLGRGQPLPKHVSLETHIQLDTMRPTQWILTTHLLVSNPTFNSLQS